MTRVAVDPHGRPPGRRDAGAAAVEFVLVGVLLTALFLAIVQLGMVRVGKNIPRRIAYTLSRTVAH